MSVKTKEKFRIIFMGTPDFAVESLKSLHESGFNVVAPDSKAHNHLVFKGYKQNDDDYITKYQRIFNEV